MHKLLSFIFIILEFHILILVFSPLILQIISSRSTSIDIQVSFFFSPISKISLSYLLSIPTKFFLFLSIRNSKSLIVSLPFLFSPTICYHHMSSYQYSTDKIDSLSSKIYKLCSKFNQLIYKIDSILNTVDQYSTNITNL